MNGRARAFYEGETTCNYCRFWHAIHSGGGECRRRCPSGSVWESHFLTGKECDGIWPVTHYSDWCGDFAPSSWMNDEIEQAVC